jgi:hypothetical protein
MSAPSYLGAQQPLDSAVRSRYPYDAQHPVGTSLNYLPETDTNQLPARASRCAEPRLQFWVLPSVLLAFRAGTVYAA